MKRLLVIASAVLLLQAASLAQAGDFSLSINVGGPPVVLEQPPAFLYPPELGYGVAVGVPYDMFYLSGIYYIYRGGGWYRSSRYGGDWIRVRPRELPYDLRRHRLARIHEYRDREYRVYTRDHDNYRGRYFRPDRGEHRGEVRGRGPGEHRGDGDRGHDRGRGPGGERGHDRGDERRDHER